MSDLPCIRDHCIGKERGNFNDPESRFGNPNLKRGCKGGELPPWSWSKWYLKTFGEKHDEENKE